RALQLESHFRDGDRNIKPGQHAHGGRRQPRCHRPPRVPLRDGHPESHLRGRNRRQGECFFFFDCGRIIFLLSSFPPTLSPLHVLVCDTQTNEVDLRRLFSHFGQVKEVKIVIDRAGVSKGYGFVTFETQEDALKVFQADKIFCQNKRLNIGQAVRRQQAGPHSVHLSRLSPSAPFLGSCGTTYLTTPTGYPYTFHNGVAYFHPPDMSGPTHWPARSVSGSPVMLTNSTTQMYPPQTFLYQSPTHSVPGPPQWCIPQMPVPSSPVFYVQPAELLYQPAELTLDGSCVQTPMPLMDAAVPEEPKFHPTRRAYPHCHFDAKARFSRSPHYSHERHHSVTTELSPPPAAELPK
uniref:RRM domain-containing protein n=1 Tax=Denticeps clupeoides TaxID=299321 RepID=A0AAY4B2S1_9TELE